MIEAFAPAGTHVLVRRFTTPEGAPKSVWSHRDTGALVLLGSLPSQWPETERVEALLPWLNDLGTAFPPQAHGFALRRYHRSLVGSYTVTAHRQRFFLADYHPRVRPARPADGLALARAMAVFHRLGALQLARHALSLPAESLRDLLDHWLLPGLQAARGGVPADVRRALDAALLDLDHLRPERLEAIDALPRHLIHGDWQAKNLLLREDGAARGVVQVLDSESCRLYPRLFDVYFLLSWDDACSGWQRPEQALARLRHYLECAGGLSPMERQLLPNLLMIKALSNAAWSAEAQPPWRRRRRARRAVLRNSLRMAAAMRSLETNSLP
ncbi:MAG: phosphotransferase [Cyanobacteriota bacterium]|nr:phosphotransferase [Cyanobacteriota bacterium]